MRCDYCGAEVTQYPENGFCVCCGGKLPDRPVGIRCPGCGTYSSGNFCNHCGRSLNGPAQPAYTLVQPVYIPVQPQPQLISGVNCCPKCRNTQLVYEKRGFSWGLGILGFFLIPVFGILLGFCGSGKSRIRCRNCNHKWKRP